MVIDTANSREEFQVKLKSEDRRNVKESYLIPALKAGLIERPISQKTNSHLQKYRLTANDQSPIAH